MPEEPFKNREIREMFSDLQKGQERIESQVRLTNGRVTLLEQWKYVGIGAISVITVIILPLLSWALWVLANMQGQVQLAVDNALAAYSIEK